MGIVIVAASITVSHHRMSEVGRIFHPDGNVTHIELREDVTEEEVRNALSALLIGVQVSPIASDGLPNQEMIRDFQTVGFGQNKRGRSLRLSRKLHEVITSTIRGSRSLNHNYIGTEHLLLGLATVEETIAYRVLNDLGVTPEKVMSVIEWLIGRGDRLVEGAAGFTPRSKEVLNLAEKEADSLSSPIIRPEHLLLGVVREGGGIAAGVLETLGVSLERVRAQVVHEIAERPVTTGE